MECKVVDTLKKDTGSLYIPSEEHRLARCRISCYSFGMIKRGSDFGFDLKQQALKRYLLTIILLMSICTIQAMAQDARERRLAGRAMNRLEDISDLLEGWHHLGYMGVDSIRADVYARKLDIWLSSSLTHIPVRYPWLEGFRAGLHNRLGFRFRNYDLELYSRGRRLEEYIPNYYRKEYINTDTSRLAAGKVHEGGLYSLLPGEGIKPRQLVRPAGNISYEAGLTGAHIALWPSHGYYYEAERDRWEWQRARLYGTIEDLFPFAFIHQYLLPMLENAGATVLMPRERDLQPLEVVVDNDGSHRGSKVILEHGKHHVWETAAGGFALTDTLFDGDNPFRMGSHLRLRVDDDRGAAATYIPDIPECGDYAVYVSWAYTPGNVTEAIYTVNHSGGSTSFVADQTMGFGTWVYLGTFRFREGKDADSGSVVVSAMEGTEGYVTTDAVRFGGGKGNVARRPAEEYVPSHWSLHDNGRVVTGETGGEKLPDREWKLSGRPRYMEGARYWLQYAGMPDSSVYSPNMGRNDYNDDFMSRGEWVNYLIGAPLTLTGEPDPESPRIPLDLVFAFHTDAGVTPCDSVIGTLSIYSSERTGGLFYTGQSRMASRDLSDIIQTHIVQDIRISTDYRWTRRGIWDRQYSEAWRPHAPAMLLELLSHQNLADMRYGLDPRFRFIVSRAIYKGMLRYLAFEQGREAVVQPLPPSGMAIEHIDANTVRLSWSGQEDPLEPTALADGFIVYTRIEDGGFDNGKKTGLTHMDFDLPEKEKLYSFRVTAVNRGGESLPGEILSVSLPAGNKKPVLVVNGFTRISGPFVFDEGNMAGVAWWDDMGVPDRYDFSHTGVQYDFSRSSDWLDDDSPGWGASYADSEGKVLAGNSFDYPSVYGRVLRENGYSFISASREAFEQGIYEPDDFEALIVIFGKQRGIKSWNDTGEVSFRVFTPGMMAELRRFAGYGTGIMLSGAYIGTDMAVNNDTLASRFARDVLGYTWRTNHACNSGSVYITGGNHCSLPVNIEFNKGYEPSVYTVEAPDAIEPADETGIRLYRYSATKTSAAVLRDGSWRVAAFGFPFEAIYCDEQRALLLGGIMRFITSGNGSVLP